MANTIFYNQPLRVTLGLGSLYQLLELRANIFLSYERHWQCRNDPKYQQSYVRNPDSTAESDSSEG